MEPGPNLDTSAKNNYWGFVGIQAPSVVLDRTVNIEMTI